MSNKSERPLSQ